MILGAGHNSVMHSGYETSFIEIKLLLSVLNGLKYKILVPDDYFSKMWHDHD